MRILLAAAAITASLTSLPALAQRAGDANRGHTLAAMVCAECHAVEATATGRSPNNAAPRFVDVANTSGMTEMALNAFIYTPHHLMPDIAIPPSDAIDLIAYILSLRRLPPT